MIIIVQKLLNADSQKFPELDKTVLKEILDLLTFYKIRGRTDYNLRNSFPQLKDQEQIKIIEDEFV